MLWMLSPEVQLDCAVHYKMPKRQASTRTSKEKRHSDESKTEKNRGHDKYGKHLVISMYSI